LPALGFVVNPPEGEAMGLEWSQFLQ